MFKAQPAHPGLAHYLIHTNDVPQLAHLGLYAARRYAGIAPDVPHAQHMPSHIFTRLGLWDEDIASTCGRLRPRGSSRRRATSMRCGISAATRGTTSSTPDLQTGRDGAAKRILDEAAGVTAVYPEGSLTNAYALAAIPARYALERGRWDEATRLAVRPAPEWRAAEAITHFARALGGGAEPGYRAGARGDCQPRGDRAGACRGGGATSLLVGPGQDSAARRDGLAGARRG